MTKKYETVPLNVISLALRQENDGLNFFLEAAERAKNPLGKAMFLSFVEDEKEHIRKIKMMIAGIIEPDIDLEELEHGGPRRRLKTVFYEMRGNITKEIPTDVSDMDAIKIAMNIERKVYKLYENASRETLNVREKELYRFLAKEEIIHFQILKNAYSYLHNLEKWALKDIDRTYEAWINLIRERDPRFG